MPRNATVGVGEQYKMVGSHGLHSQAGILRPGGVRAAQESVRGDEGQM